MGFESPTESARAADNCPADDHIRGTPRLSTGRVA